MLCSGPMVSSGPAWASRLLPRQPFLVNAKMMCLPLGLSSFPCRESLSNVHLYPAARAQLPAASRTRRRDMLTP
jgi:hypothetical protein